MTVTRRASSTVLKVTRDVLIAAGVTGGRVFWGLASANTVYPYTILDAMPSDTSYEHKGNPELVRVRIMCISADPDEADAGAFAVEGAINLKGTQQTTASALDASATGWNMVIVRKLRGQTPPAEYDAKTGEMIYKIGADYFFKLQRA